VFELRKNKWLSHGQPGCNFWLSAKVFGCQTRTKVSFGYRFMVVRRTTASLFLVVRQLFWLSRANGQPLFRTLEPIPFLLSPGGPLGFGTVHIRVQKYEWKGYFFHSKARYASDAFRGTKLTIFVKKGRFWKSFLTHLGSFLKSRLWLSISRVNTPVWNPD